MSVSGALTKTQKMRRTIGTTLSELGLREALTYTLVSGKFNEKFTNLYPNEYKEIKLVNPLSEERSTVRMGLVPSLLEVVKYNKNSILIKEDLMNKAKELTNKDFSLLD